MTLIEAIQFLDESIPDKRKGLPDEIFYFVSRITPLVNVDLLVQDKFGRILLSWRDDEYCGKGWHIPGGIVRYKEALIDRLQKTALSELGTEVNFNSTPLHIGEGIISEHNNRGHFISFLYRCAVPDGYIPQNDNIFPQTPGFLQWHNKCPSDLLKVQNAYRQFIEDALKQ
ncbi:hypothetical protein AGMMS50276_28690 [Synergistales bacterium]|nr:hypothetical protein AGMMS50276_28690 [Synergistales bacterium]